MSYENLLMRNGPHPCVYDDVQNGNWNALLANAQAWLRARNDGDDGSGVSCLPHSHFTLTKKVKFAHMSAALSRKWVKVSTRGPEILFYMELGQLCPISQMPAMSMIDLFMF